MSKPLDNCLPLQNVLWRFKFSQLKGSSDDGKARVKLLFQNPDTKQIEMKVGTHPPEPSPTRVSPSVRGWACHCTGLGKAIGIGV